MPERNFYHRQEIRTLLNQAHRPSSTFYTLVREDKIKKYFDEVAGTEVYSKPDVDAFLSGQLTRTSGKKKSAAPVPSGTGKKKNYAFRPLGLDDIGRAYQLQFDELRPIGGFSYAIQPTSMEVWIKEKRQMLWVAEDPELHRILAVIGVIPLDEELIIRFLREEFTLLEIAITDILTFQEGQQYACYLVAAADHERPDAPGALVELLEYLLSYWTKSYPEIAIRILYTVAPIDLGKSPLLHLLKTFFFSRRRDISSTKGIWELSLDEYNPSLAIQNLQKAIKEKHMVINELQIIPQLSSRDQRNRSQYALPFKTPLVYRRAETKADIAACVQIGAEIFLPPGAQPAISNEQQVEAWYSWFLVNSEIFHVIEGDGAIIGFISLIPLPQPVIDEVMKGIHPVKAIKAEDVQQFEPGRPLDTYVHIWGTTPRLAPTQKRFAGSHMLKELRRMFEDFGRRGIDIRAIYTRSNKNDGVGISEHLGMKDLTIPGVTDAPNEADRKRVFRIDTASSPNPLLILYRQALAACNQEQGQEVNNSH